ncbi:hypothetical protein Talka_01894 [Tepidimonas alkaliphilus]|uniref:Outer membrane efflux protein n=1 Tax=Tepidimonas alkaliphilus TaxID=2588942 RepID=A0A554W5M4_9BURK|nr:hypothetical protein [Tepidimonas alkaliphilus]TSE18864.1 hypothetical protein Talka_01894 [Tepidimonas alkaliphilus]
MTSLPPSWRWRWGVGLATAVAALALGFRAQTAHGHGNPPPQPAPTAHTPDPVADWRAANEAVGAFPRGHADLIEWERARGLHRAPDPEPVAAQPWTLDDVARAALSQRPDLRLEPGLGPLEQAQRRRAAAEAVLQAQALWLRALAARAEADSWRETLEAATLAAELATRAQRAGNLSAERALRETLPLQQAEAALRAAEQAERTAWVRLWQRLGGADEARSLRRLAPATLPPTPPTLQSPEPPIDALRQARANDPQWTMRWSDHQRAEAALDPAERARLQAAWADEVRRHAPQAPQPADGTPRWPHAWERALQAALALQQLQRQRDGDLHLAWQARRAADAEASRWRTQRLPAARLLEEETLLRVNGMLASPWELLAAVRERQQAERQALRAELEVWLAELARQAVLAGLPWQPPGLGLAPAVDAAASTPAKGH